MNVKRDNRYTRDHRCPICGHHASDPNGHCHGFLSDDGAYARCSRDDGGGLALLDEKCTPPAYMWKREQGGAYRPWTKEPSCCTSRQEAPWRGAQRI